MSRPLKRHPGLQPLSREHHQILLLGFKIRQGLRKHIEAQRIYDYCSWFFVNYLQPHFENEEFHLAKITGPNSELIRRLKVNHQEVKAAFKELKASRIDLKAFEKVIVSHVRFEERVLFEEIQDKLTDEDMYYLRNHLQEQKFQEHLQDVFWQ